MIDFSYRVSDLRPEQLVGFFVGWPAPPSPEQHLAALRGSYRVVLAVDDRRGVVGFINAISDGVAAAFIPWLEVLPAHQGRGIGSELMRRMLAELDHLYSVDLVCDPDLRPYYQRLGLRPLAGMGVRNPAALDRTRPHSSLVGPGAINRPNMSDIPPRLITPCPNHAGAREVEGRAVCPHPPGCGPHPGGCGPRTPPGPRPHGLARSTGHPDRRDQRATIAASGYDR